MKVLDTTILVDLLRRDPAARRAIEKLEEEGALSTTEIGAYELYLGVQGLGRRRGTAERARIDDLLDQMNVLPLERRSAIRAAEIAAHLRKRGQTIGILDLLTAAIALAHGADIVITRNVEDFRRIPGLRVEIY